MAFFKASVERIRAEGDRVPLFGIVLLAALLRAPLLSSIPNGFYSDEASTGYDAYSILKTGRDQYGEFLPLFARSFGDYVESLYRFLAAPFVGVLGLNEFATRLPAALAGVLTVWIFYGLVRELSGRGTARAAALLLAISPWHVQFSRCAFRAVLFPLFLCLGLFLFFRGLKRSRDLPLSSLAFAASLYTYSSARVFVPLFLLGLGIIFRRELRAAGRVSLVSGGLFLCVFAPLFQFWTSPEGMARANVSLADGPVSVLLNYLSYFSPSFLFFKGDENLRHSLLNMGQLYHFELIAAPAGVWGAVREGRKAYRMLWLWLFLYPIPAAFTAPSHALRSLVGAPLFALLSGCGLAVLADAVRTRRAFAAGGVLIVLASFAVYCKFYFVDYPKYGAHGWVYGMKEAVAFAEGGPYKCVVVSDRPFFYPAYIYVLFYTAYDPAAYQRLKAEPKVNLWQYTEGLLGKYYTLRISDFDLRRGTCLLMLRPDEVAEVARLGYGWREAHTVVDPSGRAAIKLIEVRGRETERRGR